jgi:hypothetical protein
VYENKVPKRVLKRHKEAEITGISGNYVTVNFIMHTADDAFSVTVITVRRGKILGQVGQQIFLQSVHTACGIHRASYSVRTVDFFPRRG